MQPHPDAEGGQCLHQFGHAGLDRAAVPETGSVFDVDTISAGVLRNHQQFFHAGFDQVLRFLHDVADRTADQIAAHRRDDAEGAAVVAAFGNFQIGIVPRRQADTLRRNQIGIGVVRFGQMRMYRLHHGGSGMRSGDGEYFRVRFADNVALGAKTAGDDDAAVFMQGFADRVE